MSYRESKYKTKDGMLIHYKLWLPENEKPKAIIQIAHGMAEHSERYGAFAKLLVGNGYGVYANDHRGHGKTAATHQELGHFAEEDGWNMVVGDIHQLTELIKENNANVPIILFGHSMGSLLARTYIQHYSKDIAGVVLSGTSGGQGILGAIGLLISKLEIMRLGKKGRSKLMDNLMFGGFNKGLKPVRTPFDWLSRDNQQVDKYVEDQLCGGICSAAFYKDIIIGLSHATNYSALENIPKDLPILIFSGDKDPVGKNGVGVREVYNSFLEKDFERVSMKLYKDGRHEMLNELNKEEVFEDIIQWINGIFDN